MDEMTATVDVEVPVQAAFNQWTQFEESPADLERFKGMIEERGVETGAWRGSVDRSS